MTERAQAQLIGALFELKRLETARESAREMAEEAVASQAARQAALPSSSLSSGFQEGGVPVRGLSAFVAREPETAVQRV